MVDSNRRIGVYCVHKIDGRRRTRRIYTPYIENTPNMIPRLILLTVLLGLSAFFSGSETAFFSLNHLEKEKLLSRTKGRRRTFISRILASPAEILITILTGNMVVNLFFASTMDVFVGRFIGEYAWLYSILIGTLLVLIFGEMTPKNLAIRHSLPFFNFSSRILGVFHRVLTPTRPFCPFKN